MNSISAPNGFPGTIRVIDSHTGGEPTRVIIEGGPEIGPGTLVDQRERFSRQYDAWRRAVIHEPRGNEVIVGALLLPPVDNDAVCSTIFFNNAAYLGMCGHGTIGLVVTLGWLGRIQAGTHKINTPAGTVTATWDGGNNVSFRNVHAYRYRKSVELSVPDIGRVTGDIAWGGNWFFLVRETETPFGPISTTTAKTLINFTEKIRATLITKGITGEDGGEVNHVELFAEPGEIDADSQNFVLCPGGAWDRSPCGTGSSAKLACLAADGKLKPGEEFRQASTTGSVFSCSYEWDGDRIIPTISGSAWVTGDNRLIFEGNDPFQFGLGI